MDYVFVGDYGFPIAFPSDFDFPSMTHVRMLVKDPKGEVSTYDFTTDEINAASVGGDLIYTVQEDDLSTSGRYSFQVVAKDDNGDVGFEPWPLKVNSRVKRKGWWD